MPVKRGRAYIAAAVATSLAAFVTTAAAQSLTLTYSLGVGKGAPHYSYSAPSAERCIALSGSASLAYPCRFGPLTASSSEEAPKITNVPAMPQTRQTAGAGVYSELRDPFGEKIEGRPAPSELPMLGSPPPNSRFVRVLGGRETLTSSLKTVDLMLKVGSKYRLKSADDGWELYKFSDSTYESRFQNTLKAIGVEVLVPFQ